MPYQLTDTARSLLDFKGVPVTILNDDGTTKKMLIACYADFKYLQNLCKKLLESQSPPPDPVSVAVREHTLVSLAQRYQELKAELDRTIQEMRCIVKNFPSKQLTQPPNSPD